MVALALSGSFSIGSGDASARLVVGEDGATTGQAGSIRGALRQTMGGASASVLGVTTSPVARLAVRQIGVHARHLGRRATNVSWGVALANPSRSNDAHDVKVYVAVVGPNGKVIPDEGQVVVGETIPVIPSGQTVYLGGDSSLLGDIDVRGVQMTASIGSTKPKADVLPSVTHVRVSPSTGTVIGTVTNPYSTSMSPRDYQATAVFFDRRGRVIGGSQKGSFGTLAAMEPGAHTSVSFPGSGAIPSSRLGSARITVLPLE
jgi:hypothetical protein